MRFIVRSKCPPSPFPLTSRERGMEKHPPSPPVGEGGDRRSGGVGGRGEGVTFTPGIFRMLAILLAVGMSMSCVSIHEGLQVDRPTEMDSRQDVTKRCPVSPYPHRLLRMHGGGSAKVVIEGGSTVGDQVRFDEYWNGLTLDPGQTLNNTVEGTNKPLIDWNTQQAAFYSHRSNNTCEVLTAAVTPMETDCLKVTFYFTHIRYQKDCQDRLDNPVFVYIYPKTELPIELKWTDDADKDGISNESEVAVGTDPMDANSKP